jgi:aminopeptidase
MMDKRELNKMLEKYIDVILQIGVDLQKSQQLAIIADIQDAELVRSLAIRAYQLGASFVDVRWVDERIDRVRFDYANPETIGIFSEWGVKFREEHGKRGDALLYVYSEDPNLLKGVKPELVAKYRKSYLKKYKRVFKYIESNLINWNVVSTALPAWAKQVFPDLPVKQAKDKLWDAIFEACRVDLEDPVKAWQKHATELHKRCQYLNEKKYSSLHYLAPGTDLTVGFPENNLWSGGSVKTTTGIDFFPNMPTEEIFTMPHRNKVNGVVSSTRPLNEMGILMDNFTLKFENGQVTKASAKVGEEYLLKLLKTDKFARQLGEVALVPNSSPVSRQNILFYNILFDENASCHLALGAAYRFSIEGGEEMTKEEFMASGGNDSLIHTDFMIGSDKMDIDGITKDGTREPIMRQGEWAFDI